MAINDDETSTLLNDQPQMGRHNTNFTVMQLDMKPLDSLHKGKHYSIPKSLVKSIIDLGQVPFVNVTFK